MKTKRPLRILIVEDEFIVAEDLRRKLEQLGHYVVGAFFTIAAAERYLVDHDVPDVVITDIYFDNSPQGISFAKRLRSLAIPFILMSGGQPKSILADATEQDVAWVLHKPIRPRELYLRLEVIDHRPTPTDRGPILEVTQNGRKIFVPQSSICYIESDKNDFIVHTTDKRYVAYGSLAALINQLPAEHFIQIHRSFIVALPWLRSYSARRLVLSNGAEVPVGRKYWPEVRAVIERLAGR